MDRVFLKKLVCLVSYISSFGGYYYKYNVGMLDVVFFIFV